jgi:hypothetical protein
LTRRDLGITGLISQYETNPGFIKIRPQGLKTDGTVRITVVWCSYEADGSKRLFEDQEMLTPKRYA